MDLELQPAPGQVPSQPPFSLTLLFNPRGFAPPHLTSAFNVQGSMHNKLYVNFETIKSGHCESKLKMKTERFAMAYRLSVTVRPVSVRSLSKIAHIYRLIIS